MDRSKTRVLVVEDQTMPRQLFAMLIASSAEFELAAAIDSAEMADVYCLRRDVKLMLMDVLTRGHCSGLEAATRFKRQTPQVRIIEVTSMPQCSYMDRARAAGVESFWYKEAKEASILDVMRRTMAGESVCPDASPKLTLGCASSVDFTGRELEVLREMIGGCTNTEIGQRLHISASSVKAHILSMLSKTGFRNRTELAVRARESGLVILDDHSQGLQDRRLLALLPMRGTFLCPPAGKSTIWPLRRKGSHGIINLDPFSDMASPTARRNPWSRPLCMQGGGHGGLWDSAAHADGGILRSGGGNDQPSGTDRAQRRSMIREMRGSTSVLNRAATRQARMRPSSRMTK